MNTGPRETVLGKPFQEYFFTTPPPFPHFHHLLYMVKAGMEGGTGLSRLGEEESPLSGMYECYWLVVSQPWTTYDCVN